MALYSVHIGEVQRSKGQNAIATSAYNSRSKLTYSFTNKKYGTPGEITWNYSDKEGLAYSKIIPPDHAPDWVYDREKLWNKAEEFEKRDNSQTARKFMVALQKEFTLEQNIALIEDIAKELVDMGMVADVCIHDDNPNNPHAHILATTRELKENRYGEIDFAPTKNRDWGSRAFYCYFREMAADKINEHFVKNGFDIKVSHLSYKEQGIDLIPTKHVGPGINITNSELVQNNIEILEENYKRILANPARILDKLTVNSPVFTKEQIATELEKVLSHKFVSGEKVEIAGEEHNASLVAKNATSEGISEKSYSPIEAINKEYSAKFMELHHKIMTSPEISMVIETDLKGRTLYTTTKRLEMEERYLSTVNLLHKKDTHTLDIKNLNDLSPTLKEVASEVHKGLKADIKRGIQQMFGIKASFLEEGFNPDTISKEQERAVLEILNGPNISVLEGIPGAGKTVSMKEIVKQYKRAGKKVIGVAPSSTAALVLEKETGIEAKNASLWRKDWMKARGEKFDLFLKGDYFKEDRYEDLARDGGGDIKGGFAPILKDLSLKTLIKGDMSKSVLTKNHVMIIDEASMMELSNMDYMLSEAARVGAKVILVGDNNQLHGVGWLGAYKKAIDICGTSRLEESRRQQNPLHREATKLLGQYQVREALKIYLEDKSIEIDKGELNCRSKLVNEYIDSYLKSARSLENDDIATLRTQVISTYTNEAALKLNKEVRLQLKDAGVIKGKEYEINVGDKKILLSRGEQIVFTRNYNNLGASGIYNGEVGTVLSMTKPDVYGNSFISTLVSKADGTKEAVVIDTKQFSGSRFSEFGDTRLLDYGYAVTAHKLQGASVDNNFLFFEKGMGYEALNVLLTRHRENLKCFINSDVLEEVALESLSDVSDKEKLLKADLRYEIGTNDKILDALVKLASKRVNTSFAGDYKNMGLTNEDKHLKVYIAKSQESVEIIREISNHQTQQERATGIKGAIWDHPKWGQFLETRNIRNQKAQDIVENYPDFKDRIIQLGMNFKTIKKHAGATKTIVDEQISQIYHTEHYKDLVHAIDEVNYVAASKAYRNLKEEIADNYSSISEMLSKKVSLEERFDELKFAIDGERNFREKLVPNYLSRIYKDNPEKVLSKFKELAESAGNLTVGNLEEAAKRVGQKPSLLGSLDGVGIGNLVGFGQKRKDAIANTENLEKQLLAYARSERIEGEYTAELKSGGIEKELPDIRQSIDIKRSLLPSALDDRFLDKFHMDVISNQTSTGHNKILQLNDFKNSELFGSIRLGIYGEKEKNEQVVEMQSSGEANLDAKAGEKASGPADDLSTVKDQIKARANIRSRIEWADVNAKLGPSTYESVFRDFAHSINPDSSIEKKNANSISCGSLNMDLRTGLWHRFSTGEGGNIYDFVASGIGKSRFEALEVLADRVGVRKSEVDYLHAANSNYVGNNQNGQNAKIDDGPRDQWNPHKEIPSDAPKFDVKRDLGYLGKKGISISNIYEYTSKEGKLLGYSIRTLEERLDKETGEMRQVKQVMPVTYCYNEAKNKSRWQLKGFFDETDHKPIYNAHLLEENSNKPVLIVEGEKAADAAAKLLPEYNVISWMGGTGGVRKVDWSQLQGRNVVIWPDCDESGKLAANYIANTIDKENGFYGFVKIVDVEAVNLPEKWDLADEFPDNLMKSPSSQKDTSQDAIRSHVIKDIVDNTKSEDYFKGDSMFAATSSITSNHAKDKNELIQAMELLEKQGRMEIGNNIVSKDLYRDSIAAIALSDGKNVEDLGDLLSNVSAAQEKYEIYERQYNQKYKSNENQLSNSIDKKDKLIIDLTREAYIYSQVIHDKDQGLVEFHHDMIKDSASKSTSQMVRFNELENHSAGKALKQIITSDDYSKQLSSKNDELINERIRAITEAKLPKINFKISLYEDSFAKLEKLGRRIDEGHLKAEILKVDSSEYNEYIEEVIGKEFDQYVSNLHERYEKQIREAKSPEDISKAITEVQDLRVGVYGSLIDLAVHSKDHGYYFDEKQEAYFGDSKFRRNIDRFVNTAGEVTKHGLLPEKEVMMIMKQASSDVRNLDKIEKEADLFESKIEVREVEAKIADLEQEVGNAKTLNETLSSIDKREKYLASLQQELKHSKAHSSDIIKTIEISAKNNKDNLALELDKKVRIAASKNIIEEKTLIQDLKNLYGSRASTKDYINELDKEIHKSNVDDKLNAFTEQKAKAKTVGELMNVMVGENDYFASLHKNMVHYDYSKHIIAKIENAHKVDQGNLVQKMHQSVDFIKSNQLLNHDNVHSKLKASEDIHAAENSMTDICQKHNQKIVDEHLKQFRKGYAVEFKGKWLDNPHEYLDHWKKNSELHHIPMKSIEKAIEHHEHHLQKSHELGGPSL